MIIELFRVVAIDFCLIVGLLLTYRIYRQPARPKGLLPIQIGIVLMLAEDVARIAVGLAISGAPMDQWPAIDYARAYSSVLGFAGAAILGFGLLTSARGLPPMGFKAAQGT